MTPRRSASTPTTPCERILRYSMRTSTISEVAMATPVVHWEFWSQDAAKVSDFYAKVFGWKIQHHPEINYRIVDTGAEGEMHGINGGIVKPDKPGPWPGNMLFYILV